MVRWPGKIESGRVSDLTFFQPDIFPTIAELVGAKAPEDLDGMSILPELLGEQATGREQEKHASLYWEYGQQTAVANRTNEGHSPSSQRRVGTLRLSSDPK